MDELLFLSNDGVFIGIFNLWIEYKSGINRLYVLYLHI